MFFRFFWRGGEQRRSWHGRVTIKAIFERLDERIKLCSPCQYNHPGGDHKPPKVQYCYGDPFYEGASFPISPEKTLGLRRRATLVVLTTLLGDAQEARRLAAIRAVFSSKDLVAEIIRHLRSLFGKDDTRYSLPEEGTKALPTELPYGRAALWDAQIANLAFIRQCCLAEKAPFGKKIVRSVTSHVPKFVREGLAAVFSADANDSTKGPPSYLIGSYLRHAPGVTEEFLEIAYNMWRQNKNVGTFAQYLLSGLLLHYEEMEEKLEREFDIMCQLQQNGNKGRRNDYPVDSYFSGSEEDWDEDECKYQTTLSESEEDCEEDRKDHDLYHDEGVPKSEVHQLYLDNRRWALLPESIGTFTGLTTLWLKKNRLTYVPTSLGKLRTLEQLYLSDNRIDDLPSSLYTLTALHTLYLDNNRLKAVPKVVKNLTSLTDLNLFKNQIADLSASVDTLRGVQYLNLGDNQLTGLPVSIGDFTALQKLFLEGNRLTGLPVSIGNLTALQELCLNRNRLTGFPDSIGGLTALEILDLGLDPKSRNPIKRVSRSVYNWLRKIPEVWGICLEKLEIREDEETPSASVEQGSVQESA